MSVKQQSEKLEKRRGDSGLLLSRLTQSGRIPSLPSDRVPGRAPLARLSGSQDFPHNGLHTKFHFNSISIQPGQPREIKCLFFFFFFQ